MIAKQKIVQALIQSIIEIDGHIEKANNIAQTVKAKFQALGIDPTDTGLTSDQITAINTYFDEVQAVKDSPVATIAKSKDVSSHSSGVLK